MLFRNEDDKLVEIKKHNFVSDTEYYKTIIKLKQRLYTRHEKLNMFNRQGVIHQVRASKPKHE